MAKASRGPSGKGQGRRGVLKQLGLLAGAGALAAGLRSTSSNGGRPGQELRKALELHQEGRYDEAVDLFARVAAARPQDPLPHILRGSAYANWGRFQEAATSFSDALDLAPDNAVVHLYRGEAYLRMGFNAEARRDFQAAMALATEDKRIASAAGARLRSPATSSDRQGIEG